MADIRKEKTYDGRWMVLIGSQVVIADLDEHGAEALVVSYRRIASQSRRVGHVA